MKRYIFLLPAILFIFSCKKETDPLPTSAELFTEEVAKIDEYMVEHYPNFDSTRRGFYFISKEARPPADTVAKDSATVRNIKWYSRTLEGDIYRHNSADTNFTHWYLPLNIVIDTSLNGDGYGLACISQKEGDTVEIIAASEYFGISTYEPLYMTVIVGEVINYSSE